MGFIRRSHVWFRTQFTVPDGFDSRTYYWMLLDAFDREDTWVYLDGELVFKQVAAEMAHGTPVLSGVMQWPVMLAARKLLEPGGIYEMALRVRYRDRADGRRLQPVSLISSNLPPMTHGGSFPDAYPRLRPGAAPRLAGCNRGTPAPARQALR